MRAVAGETLCTVSIATAPRLYSLSTVIKILPMFAGLWMRLVGGRQLHVPAVLPLLLLEESNSLPSKKSGAGRGTATSLLVRAKGHKSSRGTLEQILYFAADFLEEEYKVEPINAYY